MSHCRRDILRLAACATVLLLLAADPAQAQTLVFSSGGGSVPLNISSATVGSDPTDVTNTSTELTWNPTFGVTTKITISTSCPSQAFSLYALLTVTSWGSGTLGTAQPERELTDGMFDADLLRDIPTTAPGRQGVGTLRYRASATAADGSSAEHGDDNHSVTLTVVAQ